MNWERGLDRIVLILSIIGAVLGAAFFYGGADEERGTAIVMGALFGFFGVWVVYMVFWHIDRPICKWIMRGFREDKHQNKEADSR